MADFPILPLCTDAYLADTTHLTNEEHGCYLLLLMFIWRNNQPLPDDDLKISRMLHLKPSRWRTKIRPSLEPFFDLTGGFFRQKKLENLRAAASATRNKNYTNGVRGGRPKTLKTNTSQEPNGFFEETQIKPKRNPSRARVLTTNQLTTNDEEDSEAKASAATSAAPVISQLDPIKEFWTNSVEHLVMAGIVEKQARRIIGKWRGEFGQAAVMAAIAASTAEVANEPISFISACLQNSRMRNGANGKLTPASERFIATHNAAMETARRIERERAARASDTDDDFP